MDEQNTMGAGLETTDYGDDDSIEMNDGFDWGGGDTSPDAAGKAEGGLKITYNGQEMTLSAEEARTLAQKKGMNYGQGARPVAGGSAGRQTIAGKHRQFFHAFFGD